MEKKDFKQFVIKNKNIIIAIVLIIFLVLGLILLFPKTAKETVVKNNNAITANSNAGIVEETEFQGLKFTNITLIKNKKEKNYTFSATVSNIATENVNVNAVDIVLKDKDGTNLISFVGYIGKELKPSESTQITSVTGDNIDLTKATAKEIRVHE